MGAESAREWHSWVLKASVSGTRGSGKPSDFRHMSSAKRSQPSDLNQVDLASGCIIYIYIYIHMYMYCVLAGPAGMPEWDRARALQRP